MAMVARKPLLTATETKGASSTASIKLPIRGTNANGLPGIGLEGNRIAREAVAPSSKTTLENAAAALNAQKANAAAGVLAGAAVAGATAPKVTSTTKNTGSKTTVQPTNPYAGQMAAAQAAMNTAKPTYTDSYAGRIAQMEADGPAAYTSKYQPNIDGLLDKLQNREAFRYNLSEDPLYRQLAAQYMANGKRAMQDTVGAVAGMTGGYGSSYASTAGNQAYQQHLNQLNDKAIDLYTMARNNYDADGDAMRSNLNALQTAESMDRSNYENDRADYYNRLAALRDGQATEYQRYTDQISLQDAEQQRAWEQYKYWNDLWESKQK